MRLLQDNLNNITWDLLSDTYISNLLLKEKYENRKLNLTNLELVYNVIDCCEVDLRRVSCNPSIFKYVNKV